MNTYKQDRKIIIDAWKVFKHNIKSIKDKSIKNKISNANNVFKNLKSKKEYKGGINLPLPEYFNIVEEPVPFEGGTQLTQKITIYEGTNNIDDTTDPKYKKQGIYSRTLIDALENPVYTSPNGFLDMFFPNFKSDTFNINIDEIPMNDTETFFAEWNLPEHANLLVVGDIHGDINALKNVFVHWQKMGFIENNGKLKKNTYIVSLGDLIDYVNGSINILYALITLRKLNPNNVVLIVGNHEGYSSSDISGRNTFLKEVKHIRNKITENSKSIPYFTSRSAKILENIKKIGPSMLSIRFGDDIGCYYLMHGMYPIIKKPDYNSDKLCIEGTNLLKWPDNYDNNKLQYKEAVQWNDIIDNTLIHKIMPTPPDLISLNEKITNLAVINEEIEIAIEKETEDLMKKYFHEQSTCNYKGSRTGIRINPYNLIDIINKYKIKTFIRGHQDGCGTQQGFFHNECKNTIVTKLDRTAYVDDDNKPHNQPSFKKLSCKNINKEPWCELELKNINSIADKNNILERIFTTSMAYSKPGSDAPFGAYISIQSSKPVSEPVSEPVSASPQIGGKKYKKNKK